MKSVRMIEEGWGKSEECCEGWQEKNGRPLCKMFSERLPQQAFVTCADFARRGSHLQIAGMDCSPGVPTCTVLATIASLGGGGGRSKQQCSFYGADKCCFFCKLDPGRIDPTTTQARVPQPLCSRHGTSKWTWNTHIGTALSKHPKYCPICLNPTLRVSIFVLQMPDYSPGAPKFGPKLINPGRKEIQNKHRLPKGVGHCTTQGGIPCIPLPRACAACVCVCARARM